jgi:hypothetical protein
MEYTVTWASSDTGVATVSEGLVTAAAEGRATVTARAGRSRYEAQIIVDDSRARAEAEREERDRLYAQSVDNLRRRRDPYEHLRGIGSATTTDGQHSEMQRR